MLFSEVTHSISCLPVSPHVDIWLYGNRPFTPHDGGCVINKVHSYQLVHMVTSESIRLPGLWVVIYGHFH